MLDQAPPLSDLMTMQRKPSALVTYRAHTAVPYEKAIDWMEARVAQISAGQAQETLWFLEHPPLYTAGVSAKTHDLLTPERFPVFKVGRGGEYTYHGPGQRVVYVMLDLNKRGRDLRAFIKHLETWIIDTLQYVGLKSYIREGRVGVWVEKQTDCLDLAEESKIAAIGIRVRKWVTYHGIAINVCPNLEHFSGIVPCGITEYGITSLAKLGLNVSLEEIDQVLIKKALEWDDN